MPSLPLLSRALAPKSLTRTFSEPEDDMSMRWVFDIDAITDYVNTMVAPAADGIRTDFDLVHQPQLPIRNYIIMMHNRFACSPECFLMALAYIKRLLLSFPALRLTQLNVHRFMLVSLISAIKQLEDVHETNTFYARKGGMAVKELNRLEVVFLQALDWRAHVSVDEYVEVLSSLRPL